MKSPGVPEVCPPPEHCVCNGAGFFRVDVPIEHKWFGKAHPCVCSIAKQENRYHDFLWEESRIPYGYRNKTLNDFDARHPGNKLAYDGVLKYITGQLETPWLAIFGEYGNGKTHLSTAVVRSFVLRNVYAVYVHLPELLTDLRRGIEERTYFVLLDAWKKTQILVLDDLGVQQETDWGRAEIEELLDYRYREAMPTMITTNLAIDELTPRIARRISDTRCCTVIRNTAPEYHP